MSIVGLSGGSGELLMVTPMSFRARALTQVPGYEARILETGACPLEPRLGLDLDLVALTVRPGAARLGVVAADPACPEAP